MLVTIIWFKIFDYSDWFHFLKESCAVDCMAFGKSFWSDRLRLRLLWYECAVL